MVSLEVVAILLSGISISASLFYYANVLQNQNRTRQTQHYFEFLQTVSTREFVKRTEQFGKLQIDSYEDYMIMNTSDSEINYDSRVYLRWLNGIGMMLDQGLLDKYMVLHFGHDIRYMRAWTRIKPFVYEYRACNGMNWHMSGVESLYNIMLDVWKEQGDPSKLPKNLTESA